MNDIIDRPTRIISISQNATIKEAASKMCFHKVGCLIVNTEEGKFVGLVTERDIAARVSDYPKDLDKTTIAEIMTAKVVCCPPGTPTSKARQIMAENRIRHLPIVDNDTVVGILSARDLMGQQLLEDRAAAEEVAMLSNCLKSIDLNEVANIVTREAPRLFQAQNCILCFYEQAAETKTPALVSYNKCLCPKQQLKQIEDTDDPPEDGIFYYENIPNICEKRGAKPPRVIIPLKVSGLEESPTNKAKHLSGYLCMCSLSPSSAANKELLSYKAKLSREILNSHLTNAKLYQEARLTSITDALTRVGSRKHLEDKLESECDRAKRYKRPFTVAIIDLDNFKTINDVLGHAIGDKALKKFAECMKSQKRTPDVLARYGGDEFVILMPETKAKDALSLLERLRGKVHKIQLDENLSMTISCGISESLPDNTDSSSEVMRRADLALYEAKSSGRDCVKVWDETMARRLNASDIEIERIKKLQRHIAGLSEKAEKMFMQSIFGLVQALEAKDAFAKKHSENVMYYAVGIAQTMNIGPKQIEVIRRAAMIHDIGKIGVPDAIITKPGQLTLHEGEIVEQHPLIAVRILDKMSFLEREMAMVRHHHEKWNGKGYPDGLSQTSIPLGARILAVADTFDALTSNRSYHNCRTIAEAVKILNDSCEYDFDPEVVKAMISWVQKVSSQLDKSTIGEEQLTPDDLLSFQKVSELGFMSPVVANTTTDSSIK